MYSIQAVTLFFTLVSVCNSQKSGPVRSPFPSISGFHNTTSVPVSTTFISIIPTPVSSSVAATSSARATVIVSNGETVAVAAGALVIGAGIGGFFTVNGITAPIAGGASVIAGSPAANPGDLSNPDESDDPDDPDKPKSKDDDIATNSVPISSAPPVSATSSDIPFSSTSSSAVPTGTGVDYMIFAKENTVKADADGFGNTLAGLVGADNIEKIVNDAGVPYAWLANLNPDQLGKVKNDRVIAGTDINHPLTRDDDQPAGAQPSASQQKRAEVTQTPIAKNDIFDLRVLSTPPEEKTLPNYRYDDFAGQGITIYVVDTGPFALQHEEFRAPSPDITRREYNVARNQKYTLDHTQHGTCVASKTVGGTTGVAKRANLVGVRIDLDEFGLLRGLQSAVNDIKQKGLKGKAVVTTSILTRAPDAIYTTLFHSVMKSLIALDVPIVTAAGKKFLEEGLTEPDKLPATMAKDFPVIVVGNAGRDFKISPHSPRGNLVRTYAIGAAVRCANSLDLTGLATASGTSFAAPQVAGMVAYWMSHPEFAGHLAPGKVAETLRNMVGAFSYRRIAETGYPPIAWNGYDLAESCSTPNGGTGRRAERAMRRDLDQACSYASTSVASATPTSSAPDVPTATTTSVTATATARPATAGPATCNLCGDMLDIGNVGILGGQFGCDGAEYARSWCEAHVNCKSWAYGEEDQGGYTIPVCLLFVQSAKQIASQVEGKCSFRYHDKACPVP